MYKVKYRSWELGSKCLMMVIHPFSTCLPENLSDVGTLEPPCLLEESDLFRFSANLASPNNLAIDRHTFNFQSNLINIHSLLWKHVSVIFIKTESRYWQMKEPVLLIFDNVATHFILSMYKWINQGLKIMEVVKDRCIVVMFFLCNSSF